MRGAVNAGWVRFTSYALDEMATEGYAMADAYSCILTGEIVEDQIDPRYRLVKYMVFGEAENEGFPSVFFALSEFQMEVPA